MLVAGGAGAVVLISETMQAGGVMPSERETRQAQHKTYAMFCRVWCGGGEVCDQWLSCELCRCTINKMLRETGFTPRCWLCRATLLNTICDMCYRAFSVKC